MSRSPASTGGKAWPYSSLKNIYSHIPMGEHNTAIEADMDEDGRLKSKNMVSLTTKSLPLYSTTSFIGPSSTAAIVSLDLDSQLHRRTVLSLFHSMAKASSASLEAGDRIAEMQRVFSEFDERPQELGSALPWVFSSGKHFISSEAKAAALRHLGIFDYLVERSALTSLLVETMKSDDYLCSSAAAQSLDDIADVWTASAISAALPKIKDGRVKDRVKMTLSKIKGSKSAQVTSSS